MAVGGEHATDGESVSGASVGHKGACHSHWQAHGNLHLSDGELVYAVGTIDGVGERMLP